MKNIFLFSLTSSREIDEACPWETDYAEPAKAAANTSSTANPASASSGGGGGSSAAPDVSRTRKVSNAGTSSHSTCATIVSSDPLLPIHFIKHKSTHNNDDDDQTVNIEDLGGQEGEDNNGNEKIVDTKVTNDNVENVASTSASGSSAKSAKRSAHHRPHHKSTAKSGGGCPTSAAGGSSARSNNKKGVDSDNHGGRKGHHKPGGRKAVCAPLGLTRVEEGEGLGRLEEDANTEIESMDDSMCQVKQLCITSRMTNRPRKKPLIFSLVLSISML